MEKVFQQPNEYAGRYYMSDDGLHQYHELILKYGAEYYLGKGRDVVWKEYNVIARPIDKRENYIKRCVGIAGDKLEIKNTVLYINAGWKRVSKRVGSKVGKSALR
jgi:signal peptidase I